MSKENDFDDIDEVTVQLDREMLDRLMALKAKPESKVAQNSKLWRVVMFTDLVGSTAYYEKFGDQMGREKMLTHNALLFPVIRQAQGQVVKTIGDALMCSFGDVDSALTAGVKMLAVLRDYNETVDGKEHGIYIRIGLNGGEVIEEKGDLHGNAVNVAARVQGQAAADEILVSADLQSRATGFRFESKGAIELKGKSEPMNLFRVVGPA